MGAARAAADDRTAVAAARSAGVQETLQRGRKALTAWNVASCTWAAPLGAAAAGCQSRQTNVEVTTAQFAGRMIGLAAVCRVRVVM